MDFKDHFGNSTNAFILEREDKFVTGIKIDTQSRAYTVFTPPELTSLEQLYSTGDLTSKTTGYYKIFIVHRKGLQGHNISINDKNIQLSSEEYFSVLDSSTPKITLAGIIAEREKISIEQVQSELSFTDSEIRAYLFSQYLTTTFDSGNVLGFANDVKQGVVNIYDETALFKVIKIVPNIVLEKVVAKVGQ